MEKVLSFNFERCQEDEGKMVIQFSIVWFKFLHPDIKECRKRETNPL